jgi:uncharacterized LabA/DUF88 family protein
MAAGRTVLYIDNSNIFRGCKRSGWRPSYQRVREWLEHEEGPIVKVHFFASEQSVPREKQGRFYQALKSELGFQIHTYQLAHRKMKCGRCGHQEWVPAEKGVDVGLVTQLLKDLRNNVFETAVIMSGDRDYMDAILEVRNAGRKVELISWRWSLSKEILEMCQERNIPILFLEDFREKFEKPLGDIL